MYVTQEVFRPPGPEVPISCSFQEKFHTAAHTWAYQRESESEKAIVKRMRPGLCCVILNVEEMQAAQGEFPIPETSSITDCNWAAGSAT